MPLRLPSRLVAAGVAAAGLALIVVGVLKATTLAPPAATAATVAGRTGVSVIDTATGILTLDGPRVTVRVTATGSAPVFIGVARADDVTAYLGSVRRDEITRVTDSGKLTLTRAGTEASIPDPAGVDIWAMSIRGTGSAALTWPRTPGQWRIVVAGNGSIAAPQPIALTWARSPKGNGADGWIEVGLVLLVLGAAALIAGRWFGWPRPPAGTATDDQAGPPEAQDGDQPEPDQDAVEQTRHIPRVTADRPEPETGRHSGRHSGGVRS